MKCRLRYYSSLHLWYFYWLGYMKNPNSPFQVWVGPYDSYDDALTGAIRTHG